MDVLAHRVELVGQQLPAIATSLQYEIIQGSWLFRVRGRANSITQPPGCRRHIELFARIQSPTLSIAIAHLPHTRMSGPILMTADEINCLIFSYLQDSGNHDLTAP